MPRFLIGTSGWHYDDWAERFYPPEVKKARWLEHYARFFPTVELNNSFYRLPKEATFRGWRERTPEGFVFSVKVSRFVTHRKRLHDVAAPMELFLGRARLLGEKLGPLLYQLPPGLRRDDERLEAFLELLPRDLTHVFEFRHPSWHHEEVYALLRRFEAAFCVFDMPRLTTPLVATGPTAYVRFHGRGSLYSSSYSEEQMHQWARRLAALDGGVERVYIYFNNDFHGFALENAHTLAHLLLEAQYGPLPEVQQGSA